MKIRLPEWLRKTKALPPPPFNEVLRHAHTLIRIAVRDRGDVITHEHVGDLHRLIVNGQSGAWISHADIAAMGVYRATTDFFRVSLPRVFVVTDLEEP
jgi:hypothetical protein